MEYADEDEPLGTGGGLSLLKGRVTQTFFFTKLRYPYRRRFQVILPVSQGTRQCRHHGVRRGSTSTIPAGVVELRAKKEEVRGDTRKPEMNFPHEHGRVCGGAAGHRHGRSSGRPALFTDILDKVRAAGLRVGVYPVSEYLLDGHGPDGRRDAMRRRMEKHIRKGGNSHEHPSLLPRPA